MIVNLSQPVTFNPSFSKKRDPLTTEPSPVNPIVSLLAVKTIMFASVSLYLHPLKQWDLTLSKIWMVYPNIAPPSLVEAASSDTINPPVPRPPRVEYLATLSRHSAPVNVVRFSPNGAPACLSFYVLSFRIHPYSGELVASAGDGTYPHT
jgi:hypothetical protein